jgi:hypothetical protein
MSVLSPPPYETRPIPLGMRMLRLGVMAALLTLGVYAVVVVWGQFRPRPAGATIAAAPRPSENPPPTVAKNAGKATVPASSEQSPPPSAVSPAAASDAQPVEEPAVSAVSTPEPKDTTSIPGEGETAVAEPAPDVEPTTMLPPNESAPLFAGVLAELWDSSKQLVREGVEQTVRTLEEQAAEAAKQQALIAQQQPVTPLTAEPATTPPTSEATPEVKTAQSTRVLLRNPPESGGVIHYLVDGAAFSLHPGQMHELDGERAPRVEFHRGAHFGDVVQSLSPGTYVFQVGQEGWNLVEERSSGR